MHNAFSPQEQLRIRKRLAYEVEWPQLRRACDSQYLEAKDALQTCQGI